MACSNSSRVLYILENIINSPGTTKISRCNSGRFCVLPDISIYCIYFNFFPMTSEQAVFHTSRSSFISFSGELYLGLLIQKSLVFLTSFISNWWPINSLYPHTLRYIHNPYLYSVFFFIIVDNLFSLWFHVFIRTDMVNRDLFIIIDDLPRYLTVILTISTVSSRDSSSIHIFAPFRRLFGTKVVYHVSSVP